jgi:isoleucyl-tRNA synthetase
MSGPENLKDTLNLPKTDFPIRPNAKVDDPVLLARWAQEELYAKAFIKNKGNEKYILHDGPPYANGNIHLGHAYNKILKDILTKAYRMAGYHAPVTPGWDCHGLPIEHKVVQQTPGLTPIEIKKACRAYAQQWIDIQREEFKRLGVVMDWDNPYITMNYRYEAAIMRAFGVLLQKNLIERKNKTVAWCPFDMTTLASAEIEYQDRKDPSIYVLFPLAQEAKQRLFPAFVGEQISMLVWTTTPWTLPLNRAVAVKPDTDYRLVRIGADLVIVGASLAEKLAAMVEKELVLVEQFSSKKLTDARIEHPFVENLVVPVLFDEAVGIDEGTACVHTAPGCGPADYELGVKNNLEIYSPISPDGKYTDAIDPKELAGMTVADGQIWVIKKLAALNRLFYKTSLRHSYPHCWRCRNGLIFRATPQWFFDLKQVKPAALAAVEQINFMPERGKNFMRATVESRWEWCLSRQRSWGVPIPALLCNSCHTEYTNQEFADLIAQGVEKEGIEYWDKVTVQELVATGIVCQKCKCSDLRKETDILDVWFDSGVSHYAVLYNNPDLGFPADIYLEGLDQYRGWYQSSLLTALVLEGQAPMKEIMCHGFTVDETGRKMSKSIGNVVVPQQIIDKLGTDGLRLWVASIGNDSDAVVSERLLQNVGELFRKVRNTCRFLLQNLYDFDHERDMVPVDKLLYLDKIALSQLQRNNREIQEHYLKGNFTAVFHVLADYCTQLSSLYLDIIKDRLYVEAATGHKRRSAQTVVWYMLDALTRLIAPIFSFTAEQLSDHYQKTKTASIHLQNFADLAQIVSKLEVLSREDWQQLLVLRAVVLKAIELEREQGKLGHSLEAAVSLGVTEEFAGYAAYKNLLAALQNNNQSAEQFLKELFIVSHVSLLQNANELLLSETKGVHVAIAHAEGTKCPRCWNWQVTTHPLGLDDRCAAIVSFIS